MRPRDILVFVAVLTFSLTNLTSCSHLKRDVAVDVKQTGKISPSDVLAINLADVKVLSLVEGTEKETAQIKKGVVEKLATMGFSPLPPDVSVSTPVLRITVTIKKIKKVSAGARAFAGQLAGRANVEVEANISVSLSIGGHEERIDLTTAEIRAKAPEATWGLWGAFVSGSTGWTELAVDEAVGQIIQLIERLKVSGLSPGGAKLRQFF